VFSRGGRGSPGLRPPTSDRLATTNLRVDLTYPYVLVLPRHDPRELLPQLLARQFDAPLLRARGVAAADPAAALGGEVARARARGRARGPGGRGRGRGLGRLGDWGPGLADRHAGHRNRAPGHGELVLGHGDAGATEPLPGGRRRTLRLHCGQGGSVSGGSCECRALGHPFPRLAWASSEPLGRDSASSIYSSQSRAQRSDSGPRPENSPYIRAANISPACVALPPRTTTLR
jgi:hypothetical protein